MPFAEDIETPNSNEVDSITEELRRRQVKLGSEFDAATEQLPVAIEQREAAEKERARRLRSIQVANSYSATINSRIRHESTASVLSISTVSRKPAPNPMSAFAK
jgi:hypothetical protein